MRPIASVTRLLILTGTLLSATAYAPRTYAADTPAETALLHGRIAEATTLARQSTPVDHLVLCRAAFAQDLGDPAADECQQAANAAPTDAKTQMWLGRALGLKASHAGAMSAFGLARRCRAAFERAHALAPKDPVIASDLGEFYVGAPGILGGGSDKLNALAASMMPNAPARAHRLLALMAAKNKDLPKAEAEFKAAIEAGHTAESYLDLALFYQQQHRPDEVVAPIKQALAADRANGPVHMDAASVLIDANRDPALAESALQAYLQSDHQTDASPVFRAHLLLGKLLAKRGDKAGAHAQYALAASLAPQYEPARKALQTS